MAPSGLVLVSGKTRCSLRSQLCLLASLRYRCLAGDESRFHCAVPFQKFDLEYQNGVSPWIFQAYSKLIWIESASSACGQAAGFY